MDGGGESRDGKRAILYCIVPFDLARKLHKPLREHFREEPGVEVVVEQRNGDRRMRAERRAARPGTPIDDRRRIRHPAGRRAGQRRATSVLVEAPALPRRARAHADRLVFVERLEPPTREAEDIDTARLVTRIQGGERAMFGPLYDRYFDRVYGYVRLMLNDHHSAEDVTQQVFEQVLEALSGYEHRRSFWVWLFTIMRNQALKELRKQNRLDVEDPRELDRQRERSGRACEDPDELSVLTWISDRDLLLFVERLPLAQRQVLLLRYMLDLTSAQIAQVLSRSPGDVDVLHHRALKVLRDRLTAVGRAPKHRRGAASWQRRTSKIQVLRARRYALLRG